MGDNDPLRTQRDVESDLELELAVVGFEDAKEIGRGGFGVVYRCEQPELDRTVAVKVLTGELDENRERFGREQRAMGRLTGHPNIVGILDIGTTATGRPYLVMPYYPNGSIEAAIRRDGPLDIDAALLLGVKMAGALETAYRMGILHRDVKPANILITEYGEPVLTDFGIVHPIGGLDTEVGVVVGSPAFTSPEVLGGGLPSPASDVYGLGATLFCALTGHAPFERRTGEGVVAQFARITSQPAPELPIDELPVQMRELIESMMSRDPRARPSAMAVGESLQYVQRQRGGPIDKMAVLPEATAAAGSTSGGFADQARAENQVSRPMTPHLPPELNTFVDRRTQLSEIKSILASERLVTLTGIGGVGKSRLALRVAHKVEHNFAHGARRAELGQARDLAGILDAILGTLGLRGDGMRLPLDVLVDFLAPRNILLVLDNCEQAVEAAAELAGALLNSCPDLRIMTTSREALSIDGESVYPVPPLNFPSQDQLSSLVAMTRYDAVLLFVARAATVVAGFVLTEDNKHAVAQICARLDGLPLAIELAAARLRTMSVDQILQRLSDRFALLTRGRRGAPTRQQTLRWCLDWSYDLCTATEQVVWQRLSVFAAGCELEAAEQICADDIAPDLFMDALSGLVDKSVLIRDESKRVVRFRMLESVQVFGREKAHDSGHWRRLRERHLEWYTTLATTAKGDWVSPRQLDWSARLERELPDLRAAMEFSETGSEPYGLQIAAALYQFWQLRGRLREGQRWCERMLAGAGARHPGDRAEALFAASTLAAMQNDSTVADVRAAELGTLAETLPETRYRGLFALAEGIIASVAGQLDPAVVHFTFAVENLDDADRGPKLQALVFLGWMHVLRGQTESALACHEKALTMAQTSGDTVFSVYTSWAIGFTLWGKGERERAVNHLGDGLRSARRAREPLFAAVILETLAWIAAEYREVRRAAVMLGAAERLSDAANSSMLVFRNMQSYHDDCIHDCLEILGTPAFDTARNEGAAMSLSDAVGFALGEAVDQTREPASPQQLTKRERQVADLVARGLTNKAIASQLVISPRTAQGHIEHILTKLNFTSRAQIAAWVSEPTPPRGG